MAVDAARAHAPAVPSRPRRPRTASRGLPRRRLAGGVVWIGAVAALLAGVVALNVAVLRLNLQLDQLGSERARLRAENAELRTRAASAASAARIRAAAYVGGYRPFDPTATRFVELGARAR
ncbi:MAG: hypothetical protein ABR583_05920 [Gaiellaceae bacterium]